MTSADRRAIATALRRGDRVQIGREYDGRVVAVGVVERTAGGVIKIRVGESLMPFYRTGLERISPRRVSRGLRVIVGVAALEGRTA